MFLSETPKFFGRRKGRIIRKAKTTLLEAFLPEVRLADDCRFDRQTMFGKPVDRVYLEIGFGNGEHLAGQAIQNPSVGFIGAEVFQNGVANLLSLITGVKEGSNLPEKITLSSGRPDNIRVYDNDMRLLFPRIPDGFLDRIFVLFPDPWPKKRHASRRFINPDNLKELARILKKGGILRVATDHKIYKGWTLRSCMKARISVGRQPVATTGNTNRPTGLKPNISAKPSAKAAARSFWILNGYRNTQIPLIRY